MPDKDLVENVAPVDLDSLTDESVEITADDENPITMENTPPDEEPVDVPADDTEEAPAQKPQETPTEKVIAQRLKEIADEKNRYKLEAEQEKKQKTETVNKALEAFKALGFQGELDDVVDEVIASDKGITKEEFRKTKENERKLAEAESILRDSEAKQLELTHLAEIKKAFPFVNAKSVHELGDDYMTIISGMYQKELAGQKGAMNPVKAFEMAHWEEVSKFKSSGAAQKSQSRELRSTGGGYATSVNLSAKELADLERYNASCDDPKQRMSVAEYKRRKGT